MINDIMISMYICKFDTCKIRIYIQWIYDFMSRPAPASKHQLKHMTTTTTGTLRVSKISEPVSNKNYLIL